MAMLSTLSSSRSVWTLLLLLLLLMSGGRAQKCGVGKGDVALTEALHEEHLANPGAGLLGNVTCVPDFAFHYYKKHVDLTPCKLLVSIGKGAFQQTTGGVTMGGGEGAYPLLKKIGVLAFEQEKIHSHQMVKESSIELIHLPALESIGGSAFKYFKGKFVMRGRFPSLTTFPDTAITWIVGNEKSKMNVQCTKGNSFDIPSSKPGGFKGTWTQALYGQLPTCTTCSKEAGHVPLTKANFRSAADKEEVTCIPDHEFNGYTENVELHWTPKLEFIGASAFQGFRKKLLINGDLPALRFIGGSAFHSATSADSFVQFHTTPKLETIGDQAFNQFKGQIHITGALPNLKTIGDLAFHTASDAKSIITLSNLPKIESLTLLPFQNFGGTLTIKGAFPSLVVENNAAWSSSYIASVTPSSLIEILCLGNFSSGGFISQALGSFPGTWITANTVICNGCIMEANAVVLTHATPSADYDKVTCIAAKSFQNCAASNGAAIHLEGMEALQYIEDEAFSGCSQMDLSMTGPFPSLLTIGRGAFQNAGSSADSHITLGDAPLLTDIGDHAFDGFLGKLSVEGKALALARIGKSAFANIASEESSVVMDGADYAALQRIEKQAFGDCDGNVTMTGDFPALTYIGAESFSLFHGVLTIDASFPNLNYLGPSAFMEVESKLSSVKLGVNSLCNVPASTFKNFKGLLTLGEDFFGDIDANKGLYSIGISAFEGVTHPESRIDMLGVPFLERIGERAFYNFCGKLALKGAPKLISKGNFGLNAFGYDDGAEASETAMITLDSMVKLKSIGGPGSAFEFLGFKGTLKIVGNFSALTTLDSFSTNEANTEMTLIIHASVCSLTSIDYFAFGHVRTAASNVHLYCLDSLERIDGYAFDDYRGSLRLEDAAPNLQTINKGAFLMEEHTDRTVSVRLCEVEQTVVDKLLTNAIWTSTIFLKGGTPLPVTREACPTTTTTATTRTATTTTTSAAAILPTCTEPATPPSPRPLTSTLNTSAADCGLGILKRSHAIMTHAMLLKGSTAFKGVRCIPPGLFKSQNIDSKTGVTFNDFDALEVIGDGAFEEATGSFNINATFPALRAIGDRAFKDVASRDAQVILHEPTNLVHVGDHAFDSFQGAMQLHSNSAASLASIGDHAFDSNPSNTSKIILWGIYDLAKIGKRAFADFAGEVKIIGRARYLTDVSPETFQGLNETYYTNQVDLSSIPSDSETTLKQNDYDIMPQRITSDPVPCGQVDGDVKLTGKRIEEADFNDVTCIPTAMGTDLVNFKNYAIRSVAMHGACFPKLVWIDVKAFENSKARKLLLTMDGDFPALRYIGDEAFDLAGTADSHISLINLQNLRELGYDSFGVFEGSVLLEGGPKLHTIRGFAFFRASVQMRGAFPKLHTIGTNAFGFCKSDCNVVLNDLESLTLIDEEAFDLMKGILEVTGNFPSLQTIGADAFKGIASKTIDISCLGVDHDQAACTDATTGYSGVTVACGTVCSSATPFSSTATTTTSTTGITTTTTVTIATGTTNTTVTASTTTTVSTSTTTTVSTSTTTATTATTSTNTTVSTSTNASVSTTPTTTPTNSTAINNTATINGNKINVVNPNNDVAKSYNRSTNSSKNYKSNASSQPDKSTGGATAPAVVVTVLLLAAIIAGVWHWRKKRQSNLQMPITYASKTTVANPMYNTKISKAQLAANKATDAGIYDVGPSQQRIMAHTDDVGPPQQQQQQQRMPDGRLYSVPQALNSSSTNTSTSPLAENIVYAPTGNVGGPEYATPDAGISAAALSSMYSAVDTPARPESGSVVYESNDAEGYEASYDTMPVTGGVGATYAVVSKGPSNAFTDDAENHYDMQAPGEKRRAARNTVQTTTFTDDAENHYDMQAPGETRRVARNTVQTTTFTNDAENHYDMQAPGEKRLSAGPGTNRVAGNGGGGGGRSVSADYATIPDESHYSMLDMNTGAPPTSLARKDSVYSGFGAAAGSDGGGDATYDDFSSNA